MVFFALRQLTCPLSWPPPIEPFISAVKLNCSLSTADHFAAAAAAAASLIPLPSQHAPMGPVFLDGVLSMSSQKLAFSLN